MVEEAAPSPPSPAAGRGSLARSLIAGLVIGLPIGWLLAYLAALPAFLGMFFFLLLGLLIGAVMFRFGKAARPVPKPALWLVGMTVVFAVWGIGFVSEYIAFRDSVVLSVSDSMPRLLTREETQELRQKLYGHLAVRLKADYPPGGILGYLRWVVSGVPMPCPRVFNPTTHYYSAPQAGKLWMTRLILSFALLTFSIQSQVLGLGLPPKVRERADESGVKPPDPLW